MLFISNLWVGRFVGSLSALHLNSYTRDADVLLKGEPLVQLCNKEKLWSMF